MVVLLNYIHQIRLSHSIHYILVKRLFILLDDLLRVIGILILGIFKETKMQVDITKQEAWKLIDAIKAYMSDYTVTGPVHKTFDSVIKKLKDVVKE